VGIIVGSREVPGRNACDRDITIIIVIITSVFVVMEVAF